MFITVLVTAGKGRKQSKWSSMVKWISELWYISTIKYYLAIKRDWNMQQYELIPIALWCAKEVRHKCLYMI